MNTLEKLQVQCMLLDVVWSMIGCTKEEILSAFVSEYGELLNLTKGGR